MQTIFTSELTNKIEKSGLMAVLVIDDPEDAVPVAQTLLEGGIKVMELALRTERSLEALARICREVPEMMAGVGTIIFPEQVAKAQDAGAAFGVSPGLQRIVLEEALRLKFPFAPGLMDPSELELAISYGCRNVKLFPAEPMGGMNYIKAIYAPYAHLGVRFIPLGGINIDNLASYIQHPSILAVGGSWLAPRKLIQEKNWNAIRENTEKAVAIIREFRK